MFLLILASIIIGVIGWWYYSFFYYYGYLKKIPSPTIWPLLGNMWEFRDSEEFFNTLEKNMKQQNTKTLRMHILNEIFVITKDYKLIEHILSSSKLIDKGIEYDMFLNWLGHNVITTSGQQWRTQRKMITPTFHFKILEQFQDVFFKNASVMCNKLRKQISVPSFDVYPYVTLCTLDVICETSMGTSINAQMEEKSAYVLATNSIGKIIAEKIVNPVLKINFLYQFTGMCREETKSLKIVHEHDNTLIKNRRKKFNEELKQKQTTTENNTSDDNDLRRKKKVPFLDMLFQATIDGQPLSDSEIAAEVATFMFAGHDTTSGALSFALYSLSNHPEEQKKCFEEVRDIFGDDKERLCTLEDVQQMKYLELVIKETLRLYPSSPSYSRRVMEEFTFDGVTYPKGITIGIAVYAVHRDEELYENPEKFDPDRFSRERNDGKKPYAFLPFSAGPRNCIGQKFAMLELKTLLSTVLRNFEVKPASPYHQVNLKATIILKSSNGINISLTERKY